MLDSLVVFLQHLRLSFFYYSIARSVKLLSQLENIDIQLFYWLSRHLDHPFLIHASKWLSRTGRWPSYAIGLPPAILLFQPHNALLLFYTLLTALFIENAIYYGLKRSCQRTRPYVKLSNISRFENPPDQYSFPSGHTSSAFCLSNILSHWFPEINPLIFSCCCAMGLSRIILRVHFPLDVLAGATLGILVSESVLLLLH